MPHCASYLRHRLYQENQVSHSYFGLKL